VVLHKAELRYRLLRPRAFFYGREPPSSSAAQFYDGHQPRYPFSVMAAFSERARPEAGRAGDQHHFDMVHDVRAGCAALLIKANGLPVVANIHHPLQVDRANSVRQARDMSGKLQWLRFYPFWMQEVVARRVDRIITGSRTRRGPSRRSSASPRERIAVIYDGVGTDTFRPVETSKERGMVLYVGNSDDRTRARATSSSDGAAEEQRRPPPHRRRPADRLTVLTLAHELGIADRVTLTGASRATSCACTTPARCSSRRPLSV
jgi:hypothetical protein